MSRDDAPEQRLTDSSNKNWPSIGYTSAVAAALCLLAPAIVFLTANNYSLVATEVLPVYSISLVIGLIVAMLVKLHLRIFVYLALWVCLITSVAFLYGLVATKAVAFVAIIAAAVILLLNENVAVILIFAAVTHIASTIALGGYGDSSESATSTLSSRTEARRDLPPVLHLILDEFIGLHGMRNGLPGNEKAARELADDFHGFGFTIYSHAYSQYTLTTNSLANLVNFASLSSATSILSGGDDEYIIDKNQYFEYLSALGYGIQVYQSSYLDFCASENIRITSCTTYENNSIESIADVDISTLQKSRFILNSYLDSAPFLRRARRFYGLINEKLANRLPAWATGNSRTGPLAVMPTIERLESALRVAKPGEVHFAHLMLPHYPYVLDSGCNVKPEVRNWLNNIPFDSTGLGRRANSDESRAERYLQYYEQIECMRSILKELLAALNQSGHAENSIVIIHGDHGSRITRHKLFADNRNLLVNDDYRDGYSTFFALRRRGQSPTIIEAPQPLQTLLAKVWQHEVSPTNETHQVYLKRRGETKRLATTLLGFGLENEISNSVKSSQ